MKKFVENLLHKELSYQIHGAAIEVRKDFGPGHKEVLYQKALVEELKRKNIVFEREKSIKIYSPKDGKYIGLYRPDFIVDDKIIVETKAEKFVNRDEIKRVYDYLRNGEYELAYFINFASPKLFVKRVIFTNDRKPFLRNLLVVISLILVFFSGLQAEAARIYFEPQPTIYKVGDSFVLSLLVDTEGQSINAVDISILVPQLLKIKNISKSGSMVQLWVSEPSFYGGTINLTGGMPGGTTTSKGTIAKVTFEAAAVGEGNLAFTSDSSVLLNDGQGTKLGLQTVGGPVFQVIPKPKEVVTVSPEPKSKQTSTAVEEKIEESKDNKKPERFEILIGEDPRVFDGQKFISFFSTDKDTGIDRYEVKEGRGDYKIAQSPFLLFDQELRTVLKVRAYDVAGNYRESVYPNILKRIWWWITGLFDVL
ncbi:MAG: hypothetical protein A3B86_02570 [Candidatus Yanofskybacteria bacterium RIFCSPHIGHO2_02_FULL_38_22b]|uniref:GxxExxY protein n=1 Tax=Candidatus Yanofskybacteria bacterium RIFCSPHIGHO2_02_FULL_38_22b TaxID=1802673 RepID=A0A1F8F569_9BACT|nr:MAG: hypothetical protein A2816_03285 [Candidatus Yanofskybacteria bacterium RIFCSPHIGHO2_01_FULL_39_44]OGN07740.1 MAG: hypothetical protein A3B86_02570 [Candidatus Yanofskybacteria bacterium RIFCSPHIGHO2_02_FULL_38_22b]OGN20622.1 MAG: hypothetical protein A2910_02405 [Candidatus Yanofskybacteria bacterium RIFCSPLOWO2_01_FULL_39_28]